MKFEVFPLHFSPNADDVFDPSAYFVHDILFQQQATQLGGELLNENFAFATLLFVPSSNLFKGQRLQRPKGQVFQFPFDQTHAESISQRCKYIQGFLRDTATLFVAGMFQ